MDTVELVALITLAVVVVIWVVHVFKPREEATDWTYKLL